MKRQFKSGRQDIHAEWYQKLSRLSSEESSHPQEVVDNFFKQYNPELFHGCIDQYIRKLPASGNTSSGCASFFGDLEKMVEAVYVMHQNDYAKGTEPIVFSPAGSVNEEAYFKRTYGIAKPVFNKERFYLDPLPDSPMQVLTRIFQSSMDDSLKQTVKKWQMIAITGEYFEYQEGPALVNLLIFCEALQKVIEALYIICAAWCQYTKNEAPLLLHETYIFLSKKEQANPYLVINEFKQRFPYRHMRAETWDLGHAVSHYQESEARQETAFMENFELLLCMIKAPYLLKEELHLLPLIPDIRVKNDPQR